MPTSNFNLFFTIIPVAVTAFLGIVVYFHDRKSATNIIFFVHSLVGTAWAVVNYVSLEVQPEKALFWIRLVLSFAAPHVLLFFIFVLNFPNTKLAISSRKFWFLIVTLLFMIFLALSPFVFQGIKILPGGNVAPIPGVLIPIFSSLMVFFFLSTVILVIKKYLTSEDVLKRQWISIGLGLLIAYTLLIFLVFLRVIVWNDTTFVLYSPLFILPIFAGATYAILRHHLFNVKVIATEILTFLLLLASFVEVVIAETFLARVLGVAVTGFLLYFGILLIRSVLKEVEQRERLQELTEELKAKNAQLDELSHFKTQLLSIASHQIRSPLAAIKGFGSLLLDGTYGKISTKVRETIGKMKKSTDELLALINTLLDLRKVEEGRMEYQFAPADLGVLVGEVVENLRSLAVEKKLDFRYAPPTERVMVNADAQKLKQVIQNLADNAIKYTPAGFVHVDIKTEGGLATVSVEDSGLGISPELVPHLFEEFIRDEKVKNKILGTGLGLYIARRMLEAHGGKIFAESAGEGKGSAFYVELKII